MLLETQGQHAGVPTVKYSPWISVHVARTNLIQAHVCLHVIVLKGGQPQGLVILQTTSAGD